MFMATIRDNSAWNLFHEGFTNIINKYAPLKKYRVRKAETMLGFLLI